MMASRGMGFPSHDDQDQGWKLYLVSLIMVILAGLFVIARCATRLANQQLGCDDYTIVASMALSIWLSVMIQLAVVNGYGTKMAEMTDEQLDRSLMFFWIAQVAYKLVVGLNKTSVTLFSKRIFTQAHFQKVCWVVLFIIVGWSIGALGATVFQCIPAQGSWNPNVKASCIDKDAFWTTFAVGNVISDALVLILPLPMVFQLELRRREKFMISGVFLLGCFVLVCSVIRATVVSNSLRNQQDLTYNFIPRGIWTLLEANTGIICACLPLARQMIRKVWPSFFATVDTSAYYTLSNARRSSHPDMRNGSMGNTGSHIDDDSRCETGKSEETIVSWFRMEEEITALPQMPSMVAFRKTSEG